jgi:nucleoside phosphorylase
VYAGLAARMGMPPAASVASKMIHWFRPRFLGMTGIAAGVRTRVELGDIIAADPCWDWGSGKWSLQHDTPRFDAAPYQIGLDPWLRERLRLCAAQDEWLRIAVANWPAPALSSRARMHIGPLASGAAVLADGTTASRVMDQNRQLLGIEMEAYGIFAAAEEAPAPRPRSFVLKSVVDFADGKKDDRFQLFGAYLSAAALRHFAEGHV